MCVYLLSQVGCASSHYTIHDVRRCLSNMDGHNSNTYLNTSLSTCIATTASSAVFYVVRSGYGSPLPACVCLRRHCPSVLLINVRVAIQSFRRHGGQLMHPGAVSVRHDHSLWGRHDSIMVENRLSVWIVATRLWQRGRHAVVMALHCGVFERRVQRFRCESIKP